MPCYSPLSGWYARRVNSTGKRSIVFDKAKGYTDKAVSVPCGQCIGCRLEASRQWAVRCLHEAELHEDNCFLTMTYDESHLPKDGSLCLRDFQLFMKSLRKRVGKLRFFHCGEYGDSRGRPHYHALIFGYDFPDRRAEEVVNGYQLYSSELLTEIWGRGRCRIGDVTFESAAYVARYALKKITGKGKEAAYREVDGVTGEIVNEISPEYVTMSRRPGIGKPWLDRYLKDVYPHDEVIARGVKMLPPKYYDSVLEKIDPGLMRRIKAMRVKDDERFKMDNDSFRLPVKEKVQKAKLTFLKRRLEND